MCRVYCYHAENIWFQLWIHIVHVGYIICQYSKHFKSCTDGDVCHSVTSLHNMSYTHCDKHHVTNKHMVKQ